MYFAKKLVLKTVLFGEMSLFLIAKAIVSQTAYAVNTYYALLSGLQQIQQISAMLIRMQLVVILTDIRSAQNVGSIFRSADAVGALALWTCGLTPYPHVTDDQRPPHVADRAHQLVAKTALGAETLLPHRHFKDLDEAVTECLKHNYIVLGLEQAESSVDLFTYQLDRPAALILGREVSGLSSRELALCDVLLEIPMYGAKESLNVAVAAGVALYALRNSS